MKIPRKTHEWAAERFGFVQYPRSRNFVQNQTPGLIDKLFKYGLFAWLMFLIWGGAIFWAAVILILFIHKS
jgi:hypothetical protein